MSEHEPAAAANIATGALFYTFSAMIRESEELARGIAALTERVEVLETERERHLHSVKA